MIAQHMDYFMSSHFITLKGFVSLYFVVGRILAFRYILSLMLCENKIRPQFNFCMNTYCCSFHFRAAIFESFGFVSRSRFQFEGRALYTLRPNRQLCHFRNEPNLLLSKC